MALRKPLWLFLGAPGSGKGTYASRLAPLFNLEIVSSGGIIREEIKRGSPFGQRVEQYSKQGRLVPDVDMVGVVQDRLSRAKSGVLLDGFPRTLAQAQVLQEMQPVSLALNVVIPEKAVVAKALGRRACATCERGYNLADVCMEEEGVVLPPIMPAHGDASRCDCGGALQRRDDDTREVIEHRLEVYREHADPLVEYYRAQQLLFTYKVRGGLEDMAWLEEDLKKRVAT